MIFKYAALLFTLASLGEATTIQFIGAPTGVNDGSYYVLPYQITIDGSAQDVTCYDFLDDVSVGDTWQANILSLSGAGSSNFFTNASLASYERVAWLSAQTYSNSAEQVGLQYAIWDVFGSVGQTADSIVYEQAADAAAADNYAGVDFSSFRFIQEVGAVAGGTDTKQAFVYQVAGTSLLVDSFANPIPEPGTITLFAAGVLLLVAGKLKIRN
jgi:hypothetical protein